MVNEAWQSVRRVLAVRLDNIGDIVMLSPALRTLKQSLPDSHITLMASPAGSQVASLLPWVDDTIVHRAVWQSISGAAAPDSERELELVKEIRERGFDAAIIFTSFSQSPYPPAYVCYLAGIPLRLGQSKEFGGSVLSHWVKPLPDYTHQVDRNLHLLEAAGFAQGDPALELRIPASAREHAEAILCKTGIAPGEPFVVLAPGASAAARRYDLMRYRQVAALVAERTLWPVVVIGSSKEMELAQTVTAGQGLRVISIAGQTSLPDMAEIICRSSLVIANDSGPMHLADAFRRPMVILFSGTEYESQWQPRSAPARLLRRPTDCSPCYAFRCPFNMECLDIAPDQVVAAALEMLNSPAVVGSPVLG